MNRKIVTGRNFCQHKVINLSYRYRGNLERISKKEKKNKNVKGIIRFLKKSKEVNKLKNNTIPYSPTKINANAPLEYSVLNPDTNSDSPSEKSKGARLHSAMHEKYQMIKIGKVINVIEEENNFLKSENDKNSFNKITEKIVKDKEIS
jgi:hypothetical protein